MRLIETGARYRQGDVGAIDDAVTSTLHGKIGTDTEMADYSLYDMLRGTLITGIGLPRIVTRGTSTLPQTADLSLFTITDYVELLALTGRVTTAIGNVANASLIKLNPTGAGADTDLCAALDIDNDAAGTIYSLTGTVGDAMTEGLWMVKGMVTPLILGPGIIELECAGNSGTGAILWTAIYRSIAGGLIVTA